MVVVRAGRLRLEGSLPGECREAELEGKSRKTAVLKWENPGRDDNYLAQAWVMG